MEPELDISGARQKIVSFIKDKVEASQTDEVVFRLEGRINSAVTAYLCIEALGTRRVTGLLMPDLRMSDERELAYAKIIADELCLNIEQVDIAPIHKVFMQNLHQNRSAEENLRARIRMSLLYYHANTVNRLVIGTMGKEETLLGTFTKYGNGGADILPIADLRERDIRKLGEVLGINRRLVAKKERERVAGGQVARVEAEVDDEIVDKILDLRRARGMDVTTVASRYKISKVKVDAVMSRYEVSSHKRSGPEICRLD